MFIVGLFIGVVSHPETPFRVNQGHLGLAALLSDELRRHGVSSTCEVNVKNSFDESGVKESEIVFRKGIAAEVRLESQWYKYLGSPLGLRYLVTHSIRWLRVQSFCWRKSDVAEIRRLINIELSHRHLMKKGLESRSEWILILEDDAGAQDIADIAIGLKSIMDCDQPPIFVNLSKSFSLKDLGINHLLSPSSALSWSGTISRTVMQSERPATNTVCAILYQRDFLVRLVSELEAMSFEPVIPIDWRINEALINLWAGGQVGSGECCFIDPAPIVQLSMHK